MNRVDLPAPLGPTNRTVSPRRIWHEIPSSTGLAPKYFDTAEISTMIMSSIRADRAPEGYPAPCPAQRRGGLFGSPRAPGGDSITARAEKRHDPARRVFDTHTHRIA
ncbi:MAG TPA: hypothetical protein QGF35_02925 [Dehalococcoidia bacterium]|nr:hypothetical protein [Dehalococcoidia bacterium]